MLVKRFGGLPMDFKHFKEAYYVVKKYQHDNSDETLPTMDLFSELDGDVYHALVHGQCFQLEGKKLEDKKFLHRVREQIKHALLAGSCSSVGWSKETGHWEHERVNVSSWSH